MLTRKRAAGTLTTSTEANKKPRRSPRLIKANSSAIVQSSKGKNAVETSESRARKLVDQVTQLHEEMKKADSKMASKMSIVNKDGLSVRALKLLEEQASFKANRKSCTVDIGYHYTQSHYMPKIGREGLLTKAERDAKNIKSQWNGSCYGDGVYTANGPFSSSGYGNTGIIVARIKGKTDLLPLIATNEAKLDAYDDGNVVVLRRSSQCIPLVSFDRTMVISSDGTFSRNTTGSKFVIEYANRLQKVLKQCCPASRALKVAGNAKQGSVPAKSASKATPKPRSTKQTLKPAPKLKPRSTKQTLKPAPNLKPRSTKLSLKPAPKLKPRSTKLSLKPTSKLNPRSTKLSLKPTPKLKPRSTKQTLKPAPKLKPARLSKRTASQASTKTKDPVSAV